MRQEYILLIAVIMIVAGAAITSALPEGPSSAVTVDASSFKTAEGGRNVSAIAGNVTQLSVQGSVGTTSWAGFYGNITGEVTLETSVGFRMYKWDLPQPKGEIYATESNTVPTWGSTGTTSTIECWNYSHGMAEPVGDADFTNLEPGKGYWVETSQACTLEHEP